MPDSRTLVSGSEDGTVRTWDLAGSAAGKPLKGGKDRSAEALAIVPKGPLAFHVMVGWDDGTLESWLPATGARQATATRHRSGIRQIAATPDGTALALAGWEGVSLFWSDRPIGPENLSSPCMCFSEGDEKVLVGNSDGTVHRYDRKRREVLSTFRVPSPLVGLVVSPDGKLLAAADAQGTVTLLQVGSIRRFAPKPRHTLRGHEAIVLSLAFSPDSATLLTGSGDGTVRLWDVAFGKERASFRWHTKWVTCVAFAPDGMTAAAGSEDHTVVVWDITGET
jgi:WD40 repeat protein